MSDSLRERWEVETNRHPSEDGRQWGWVACGRSNGLPGVTINWRGEEGRTNAQHLCNIVNEYLAEETSK